MKYRHNRKRRMIRVGFLVLSIIFIAGVVLFTIKGITKKEVVKSPEQVLKSYMNCICQKNYSEMYEMITNESKETIEKEDFVKRNSAIYEGIEAKNINIKIIDYEEESLTVKYNTAFDTVAGKVDFKNEVAFLEQDDQYKMVFVSLFGINFFRTSSAKSFVILHFLNSDIDMIFKSAPSSSRTLERICSATYNNASSSISLLCSKAFC